MGGAREHLKVLSVPMHTPFCRLSQGIGGVRLCAGKRVWNQANACASVLIYPEAEVNDVVPLCLVFFSLQCG